MNTNAALKIHPEDDLIVALRDLEEGQRVTVDKDYTLTERIPARHQFAARDHDAGEKVRMYGIVVGETTEAIRKGACLTTGNLKHAATGYHDKRQDIPWTLPPVDHWRNVTFQGFVRKNGSAGTANYWLVAPLVFCENGNILTMKEAFHQTLGYEKIGSYHNLVKRMKHHFENGTSEKEILDIVPEPESSVIGNRVFANVDGIKFITHTAGCGGTRRDARNLCGLLAGYIYHPNVAGSTVLSLGCQNAPLHWLVDELKKRDPDSAKPLFLFEHQKSRSGEDMLNDAIKKTFTGLIEANKTRRQSIPINKLVVGMECGGSDGFSGISANPVMGRVADLLVACGGSVILSEFPEFCGTEQSLIDRCIDRKTAAKFIDVMKEYESEARAMGASFDMNPSPGNIENGLITDAIKSAGAVRKGGTSPIVDVLDYPRWVRKSGLSLLCTPGGDVESTTAMGAAGANLLLFSTGMGTPTGNPVVPVIKIASNSKTAVQFPDMIDFDAGPVINGTHTIEELAENLLRFCIEIAGGRTLPKAVRSGFDDFIFWKRGVSL